MPRWISLASCFSLAACGDPLNGTGYYGTPLLTMSGEVLSSSVVGSDSSDIRIALLWSPPGGSDARADSSAELATDTIITWSMTLYHPPEDGLIADVNGAPGAIAFPILYIDEDGSGSWNEEWVIGGSSHAFVLYFTEEPPEPPDGEPGGPADEELPELGYNVVSPPDCDSPTGSSAPTVTAADRVNLEVGDIFFNGLPDTNCDGSLMEWDILCESGCGSLE